MSAMLARHSPWIIAGLAMALLAAALVVMVDDILSQPRFDRGVSTLTYRLNDRADTPAGEIVAGTSVGQTFLATEANLSSVDVLLATYRRQNHAPVVFSLFEYPRRGAPLRTVVAQPDSIVDNQLHSFQFAPIADSAGKTYLLTLESPRGVPGDAFTAWFGKCDCYPQGTALLNGSELPQRDLAFRLEYHYQATGVLVELVNRMSQYKPWFFKGGFLVAIGLLTLASTLLAVGYFAVCWLSPAERQVRWPWIAPASLIIIAVTVWFVVR